MDASAEMTTRGWAWRNRAAALFMAILLIGAALLGQLGPAEASLTSNATAYNVFHFIAGLVALIIHRSGRVGAAAGFNFGFGLIDLYQALAGIQGWPPAQQFQLRPADHVIHVILGTVLVAVALPLGRSRPVRW